MQILLSGGCALGFAPSQVLPLQFKKKKAAVQQLVFLHFTSKVYLNDKERAADQYEIISYQAAYRPAIQQSRLPSSLHEVGGGPFERQWVTPPALPPGHS